MKKVNLQEKATCTGNLIKAVPRLDEIFSCCCLPLLPQLDCGILPTMHKDFFQALYVDHIKSNSKSDADSRDESVRDRSHSSRRTDKSGSGD